MIQMYYTQKDEFRKLAKNEDFQKIWRDTDFIWLSVIDPTGEEYNQLGLFLSVDPKSLSRVFERTLEGRYHRFYEYSAFHVPTIVAKPVQHSEPVLILLGEKIVATVGKNIPPDAVEEVEQTLRNLVTAGMEISPSLVAVRIVQELIERNILIINQIVNATKELESKYADISINTLLAEIQRIRALQNEFYQHLTTQRNFVGMMLQHVPRNLKLSEELRALLDITIGELERQQQALEINARNLTDLVSLHSILLANRLNRIIVILTAITVTVAVPSLVANILGMSNVFWPFPIFYLPNGIPIYTWQIQLLILIPAILIPIAWVIRKGWVRTSAPPRDAK
ncbi:MAG: CorA family divalent cation transporter [Promethearchaeota archaeon]